MHRIIKGKGRWLLLFVLAVIVTLAVELLGNLHALTGTQYTMTEENHFSHETEEDTSSQHIYYAAVFEDPQYISKIKLNLKSGTDCDYDVELTVINDFEAEETITISDTLNEQYRTGYTNIGETVKEIKVWSSSIIRLDSVEIYNRMEINKYRMLFVFILVLLAGSLFVDRELASKKIEYYFFAFSVLFGCLIIYMIGPGYYTWDEEAHFKNVYTLASDSEIEWNQSAWEFYNKELPDVTGKDENYLLTYYTNAVESNVMYTIPRDSTAVGMSHQMYVPFAVVYRICSALGIPFAYKIMAMRIFNLLVCSLIVAFAIHIAKARKLLIAFCFMLPTLVFQMSTITYDGLTNALILLGSVLWMNEMVERDRKLSWASVLGSLLCITVGSFAKAVYIPLILMMFLYPVSKFSSKNQRRVFRILIVVICLLMIATFAAPVVSDTAGTVSAGADARGGETSTGGQIMSMIYHPLASAKLMITNVFSFDNFRNLGNPVDDSYLFTTLFAMNFALLGVLGDQWNLLLIPALLLVFLCCYDQKEPVVLRKKERVFVAVVVLLAVCFIWGALYLSFTEVGSESIAGVQARYYLPFILPVACVVFSHRIQIRVNPEKISRLMLLVNCLIMSAAVYELVFKALCV